jgi:hypothetical protein
LRHEIKSIGKDDVQARYGLLDYLTVAIGRSVHPSCPGGVTGSAGAERDYWLGFCDGSSL